MKIMDSEFKRKVQVAGRASREEGLPSVDRKTDGSHDLRFFRNLR